MVYNSEASEPSDPQIVTTAVGIVVHITNEVFKAKVLNTACVCSFMDIFMPRAGLKVLAGFELLPSHY